MIRYKFKVQHAVAAITAALVLSVLAASVVLVRDLHRNAIADGQAQASRFVSGAQAAANRSLLGVDVLLASLSSLLNLENMQADWLEGPLAGKLIQGATRQNLLVRSVWLIDAQSTVLASSAARSSEGTLDLPKGFATEAISHPISTLVISQPFMSPNSAEMVLLFARHLPLADGTKLLAVAEVPVNPLTTILVQGADINALEATIERSNGQLLASVPPQDTLTGSVLSPAMTPQSFGVVQTMPSRIQQRPALVASRPMLYNELLITASIPMDTVLAEWQFQAQLVGMVGLVFSLFLGAAGYAALRYLQSMGRAQRSISHAKATTDQALESMESGFLLLDAQRRVVTWNRRYLEFYPWQTAEIRVGRSFEEMLMVTATETLGDVPQQAREQWVSNRMAILKLGMHSHEREFPNGRIIEITERATPDGGVVIVYQDVTRLRRASAEIAQLAYFDPLTSLPNRRLLTDRLQQALIASLRSGRRGALLFMDLDHFKTLNDTLGHDVGDLLLQQVAVRVKNCVREADTVARLGGDEFVIMLLDLSPDEAEAARQAQLVGDNILRAMAEPFTLHEKSHRSSCSLGATLFGEDTQDAAELLKQADIAMYQVKSSGRNAFCFFDPGMLAVIEARAALEIDLRLALQEAQFELFYQVQASSSGTPVGAEALIRWHHPTEGLVLPARFIGVAEETGLILPMGLWVMEQACTQLAAWQSQPEFRHFQLSVNVSARQFRQPDFVNQVARTLRATGAHAELLKLELTESLVLDNVEDTIEKMHALKSLGVRFSMDDFGTGHSSLSYLTRLPLNQLKIDQSFVHNIGLQATDSIIIQTIIGMGRNLGLEVLAEGVETEAQHSFLSAHGCDLHQGYLLGRPQPVGAFMASLTSEEIAA
ncbi:EAL domain-containing protein [Rhodoferax sp.]|uniref:bifunctional diguanylate cyclase/phosphodiesterase n=1 Tax=Rhodoferax sp. TaxID=50421 RepID=UPI0025D157C8|nr:EAL domain-containing protein [Rhodoferax sp.]